MVISTYYLSKIPAGDNAYGVDRSENWVFKTGPSFETVDQAKVFVLQENLKVLPSQLHAKVKQGFATYSDVCINPIYIKYHKYFLDKPDINVLKRELEQDGIKVI